MSISVTVVGSHGRFGPGGGLVSVSGSFANQGSALQFILENNAESATVTGGPFGFGTDIPSGTITASDSVRGVLSVQGSLNLSNGDTAQFGETVGGFFNSSASLVVESGADTVYAATGAGAALGIFELFAGSLGFIHQSGGAGSVVGAVAGVGAVASPASVAGSSAPNLFYLAAGGLGGAVSVPGAVSGADSVSSGAAGTQMLLPDCTSIRFVGVDTHGVASVPGGFSI